MHDALSSSPDKPTHCNGWGLHRRDFLRQAGGGCGGAGPLLAAGPRGHGGDKPSANPLAAKKPHHEARAKSVIFLFMVGGPSPIDLFDPKPALAKWQGKPLPASFGKPVSQFTKGDTPLLASTRKFAQARQVGPRNVRPDAAPGELRRRYLLSAILLVYQHRPCSRRCTTCTPAESTMGYPSLGSWVTYGLGTVSDNLPAYCVLLQPEGTPEGGAPCWGAGFLPAVYQGTLLRKGASPILNLQPPAGAGGERQKRTLDLLRKMNEPDLDARRQRPGSAHRHLRAGLPDAEARPGSGGPGQGNASDAQAVRPRRQGDGRLRHAAACWPADWSSAACASCRSTPAAARW